MKKKFTGMLICLLMVCMSLFAGCSLVEVDSNKYYNSVVSEIKDKDGKTVIAEITSEELLNGYQSYGYYYEYYYGMSKQEAVEKTIKLLQNREITLIEAEKKWEIDRTGKNLTDLEKTYIWQQVVDTLQSNLDYYYKEIVGEEDKEEEKEDEVKFEGYEEKAYLSKDADGSFIIKEVDKQEGVLDGFNPASYKDYNDEDDRAAIYSSFYENNKHGKHFEAYTKYLNTLKLAEKDKKLSTNAKDVFEREIAKLYNQSYENYVIARYTEALVEGDGISSISVQDILDLYSSKVRASYTQYGIEGDSSYNDNMKKDPTTIYYYSQGQEATKFFSVANILFNKVKDQEGKYELVVRSDDGSGVYNEESTTYVSKSDIYKFVEENIENVISAAQASSSSEIIGDSIKECVFKYNQDPGMLSADGNYVIGVDSEGKAVSDFVAEFNDAGLELYNGGAGKMGDIAIAESDYGIHVLVYTGACENLFVGIDSKFALQNTAAEGELSPIEVLYTTRVSPMLDKTIFDVLYDELYVDNSTMVQEADTELLRTQYSFTIYNGRIPETLK
ncbi:MAG: hypothetical protein J6A28_02510 [Clostridia bacterium]|nr:hypothetical protein [Clostridia bacterium]